MHKVEVDDEVFAFVQQHAEPLVDDFNSALRRILAPGRGTAGHKQPLVATSDGRAGYQAPPGTPQALVQILDIVRLVRDGTQSRIGATQQVAKKRGLAVQTVLDKYTRQLGLEAAQFDRLLAPERSEDLRKLLHSKFRDHIDAIDEVLSAGNVGQNKPARENLVDIVARFFGPEHGAELEIPHRGTVPHRAPPDFSKSEYEQ